MECPKCGFEQPEAEECRSCGIVISKYNPNATTLAGRSRVSASELPPAEGRSTGTSARSILTILLIVVVIGYGGFSWWNSRPVSHGPGVVAPDSPEQTGSEMAAFEFKSYRITPLADFHANARVLSRKKYAFGIESELAPVDLALGWGRMSDEAVLGKLDIHQANRFYFWQTKAFPIPRKEIETHSANMHLIPSNADIERRIRNVRVGNVVDFRGYLVQVTGEDNWKWKSSLSRTDTGGGACEVVFVEDFRVSK